MKACIIMHCMYMCYLHATISYFHRESIYMRNTTPWAMSSPQASRDANYQLPNTEVECPPVPGLHCSDWYIPLYCELVEVLT